MGTSGAYGGSGGAWAGAGREANKFVSRPSEETAEELLGQALEVLDAETTHASEEAEDEVAPQPLAPGISSLPGLRVRRRAGAGDGAPAGGAAGGGRGGRRGGGGRSRAATAGGRAIAAGFALSRGDADALRELGLSLTELEGLNPYQQINRILNVTVPATGAPLEAEARSAAKEALIMLLVDGEDSPRAVLLAFVKAYVFECVITEFGSRLRASANANDAERLLRDVISAHADKVPFAGTGVSVRDFRSGIETVTARVREVFAAA